jgi:hypothetical protein
LKKAHGARALWEIVVTGSLYTSRELGGKKSNQELNANELRLSLGRG